MRIRHRKQTYPIWPMTQRDEVFGYGGRGKGGSILTRHAAESHEEEATNRRGIESYLYKRRKRENKRSVQITC